MEDDDYPESPPKPDYFSPPASPCLPTTYDRLSLETPEHESDKESQLILPV